MENIKLLHAIAGATVGLTGLAQIIMKKGGRLHRVIGMTYFWSWLVIVVTGGIIGSAMITFFGVLGFYMALTGYRFGHLRSMNIGIFEKAVVGVGLAFALGTLGWGAYMVLKNGGGFGVVAVFFGVIFTLTAWKDFREFVQGKPVRKLSGHRMQWYFEHFGRMYISYIAAMTAFTVIQNVFGVVLLDWILPTVIGTALIVLTNRHYFKQFNIS
ncbi:MAG: hypothetical protein MUC59_14685 [Saprospiraceae bacterium]|jgi:hypothetical protein|nr:hypothetical protein [Saprospiraceae bacterium]